MRTKAKKQVHVLKVVALLEYEIIVQISFSISLKHYAYVGCVVVVPLASIILSTV